MKVEDLLPYDPTSIEAQLALAVARLRQKNRELQQQYDDLVRRSAAPIAGNFAVKSIRAEADTARYIEVGFNLARLRLADAILLQAQHPKEVVNRYVNDLVDMVAKDLRRQIMDQLPKDPRDL